MFPRHCRGGMFPRSTDGPTGKHSLRARRGNIQRSVDAFRSNVSPSGPFGAPITPRRSRRRGNIRGREHAPAHPWRRGNISLALAGTAWPSRRRGNIMRGCAMSPPVGDAFHIRPGATGKHSQEKSTLPHTLDSRLARFTLTPRQSQRRGNILGQTRLATSPRLEPRASKMFPRRSRGKGSGDQADGET